VEERGGQAKGKEGNEFSADPLSPGRTTQKKSTHSEKDIWAKNKSFIEGKKHETGPDQGFRGKTIKRVRFPQPLKGMRTLRRKGQGEDLLRRQC